MDPGVDKSEISSRAADWVARLDREGDSASVREELERWLEEDRRHRGAFLRASAAWTMLDRAKVLRAPRPASRPAPARRMTRRTVMGVATGAAAAIAASAAGIGVVMLSEPRKETYRTALGELRRIRLEDGSVMALNSQTAVEVMMGRDFRRLNLIEGEAWFQVAKDASRPFTVEGDGSSVRAVGTAFSVRRRPGGGADVVVTEGVVELRGREGLASPVRLAAGARAVMPESGDVQTERMSVAQMDR